MFAIEMVTSWYAGSTALLADALDFFADTASYGITLFVLAKSARLKAGAALAKGLAMGAFGFWVIALALYRADDPVLPDAAVMGGVGVLALAANAGSAVLLYWHRGDDLNMRSVWLCSRNDAIANIAVILAAGAVAVSATAWPDLAAGVLIAGLEL
ncbi:MAG: cation transporter, partial [Proteobacteria bacterium]|nr:cation transporter [Pseudomonadota bacterium]